MPPEKKVSDTHDPWTRREVLRAGALTAFGLGLGDLLRARALAAERGEAGAAKAKSCILIWLDGGPSHIDTFDPKPDAPLEVRGAFRPIETKAPGLRISELFPLTAAQGDKIAVVRSMTSTLGEHNFGSHYLLTGYRPSPALTYPSLGAVTALCRGADRVLPAYIALGDPPNDMAGAGYLAEQFGPFVQTAGGRSFELYEGLTVERLERRKRYDAAIRSLGSGAGDGGPPASEPTFERAFRLITSDDAKRAFDPTGEPAALRARYGGRSIGQACLIARRLVERGVPFVTVTDRGWDTHDDIYGRLKEGYTGGSVGKAPILDQALSALLEDLALRGLLGETLIVVAGEFGRTPKLNTSRGRDHWPRVFSVLLAGGGVPGGQAIGSSDALAESPADRPVTPTDLARTVFHLLGVDPDRELHTRDGRPVRINAGGSVIEELVG